MAGTDPRRRFPVVLTLFAAIAFAILCSLGAWQFQRMQWKRDLLARIETARTGPVRPLAEALAAGETQDASFTRVVADCLPADLPRSKVMLAGLKDGRPVWRPMAPCRIAAPPYDLIVVDRGVAPGESPTPPDLDLGNPVRVEGVLRRPETQGAAERIANVGVKSDGRGFHDRIAAMRAVAGSANGKAAPYVLVVERETPPPPGVTAVPLPTNISNRHLEYVITWFGLAAALAAVYAAMLMKRLRG